MVVLGFLYSCGYITSYSIQPSLLSDELGQTLAHYVLHIKKKGSQHRALWRTYEEAQKRGSFP